MIGVKIFQLNQMDFHDDLDQMDFHEDSDQMDVRDEEVTISPAHRPDYQAHH